ncbi:hypothetical protein AV654_12530 [Paenibacillus elgii]|uniref:Uncharacterized protein n=1 Tax=Paenibacillus elgii TaxID=189691 RepID=A0A161URN6_9BACL|nr:hypothetical protein AV654_12530 [Paenibacillus elgii]
MPSKRTTGRRIADRLAEALDGDTGETAHTEGLCTVPSPIGHRGLRNAKKAGRMPGLELVLRVGTNEQTCGELLSDCKLGKKQPKVPRGFWI